jgi:hypothetical protein
VSGFGRAPRAMHTAIDAASAAVIYWPRKGVFMKALKGFLVVALLGAASLADAQVNIPDPNLPGGSMNTAVRIVATNELMIDRSIKRWIRTHYPGWDADPYEIQEFGEERYAVVYISSANNPSRRVYFKLNKTLRDDDDDGFPPL